MTILFPKNKKAALKEISTPAGYVNHVAAGLKLPGKAVLCPISSLTRYVESHYYQCLYRMPIQSCPVISLYLTDPIIPHFPAPSPLFGNLNTKN